MNNQFDEDSPLMSQSMYVHKKVEYNTDCNTENVLDELTIVQDHQQIDYDIQTLQSVRFPKQVQQLGIQLPPPLQVSPQVSQHQLQQSEIEDGHNINIQALQSFLDTIEVQFCITSAATRSLFTNTKQVRARQTLVQNTKKIWLENQCDCVHSMFDTKTLRILIPQATSKNTRQELLSQFHCSNIQGFVRIFCQLPEVRDSIFRQNQNESVQDKYGINAAYSELVSALQEYVKDSVEYKDVYDNKLMPDIVEKYLTRLIYEKVFPKDPTARDIELNMRIKTLEWVTNDHLEIKEINRFIDIWQHCGELLNTICNQKNGIDKLEILLKTTQLVTDTLRTKNNEASSADVVFPIIIRILLNAQPRRLQSNINFVELFTHKSRMMSESGYCFTQIKSAILWLESVNHEQLKLDATTYNRLIYEKEVKYNMIKCRVRKERVLINYQPNMAKIEMNSAKMRISHI